MTRYAAKQNAPCVRARNASAFVANAAPVRIWMSDVAKLRTYSNQGRLEFRGDLEAELGTIWTQESILT